MVIVVVQGLLPGPDLMFFGFHLVYLFALVWLLPKMVIVVVQDLLLVQSLILPGLQLLLVNALV